jgi:hypothetical protein
MWNDTFSEIVGSGAGPYEYIRTVLTLNSDANQATNYQFSITSVTDADTCSANPAQGDIKGTNSITINPIPTAALLTTNAPGEFATTNCDSPSAYNISNILTGIGPWTIFWNDGLIFTNGSGSGPYTNNRAVAPLPASPNDGSNSVFYITNVIDGKGCVASSIVGTNQFLVLPRPTATLVSTTAPGLFTDTNCGGGITYNLTNVLTGIGPWTISWNDGTTVPNVGAAGPGPYTDVRSVLPIPAGLFPSNNVFFITNVTDADGCVTKTQDIHGTNSITVRPTPTATLYIDPTNITATVTDTKNNVHNMISSVSNPSGTNIVVEVVFSYVRKGTTHTVSSVPLEIDPRAFLTGTTNWTVGFFNGFRTNTVTTNKTTAVTSWTFPIPRTSPATNFYFSITNLSDGSACPATPTNFAGVFSVSVNQRANAALSVDGNFCGDNSANLIQVDLSGTQPWTIRWADGVTNSGITNTPFFRSVALQNNTLAPITNTYSITNVSDATTTNTSPGASIDVQFDPIPTNAPRSLGDRISCVDVPVALSVAVSNGFTADWYADSGGQTNLASGTTNFVPPVPVNPGSNSFVTNIYYSATRFDDDDLPGACHSTNLTAVSLISVQCTNPPLSTTKTTTNIMVRFAGNYVLQTATNLAPPVNWSDVITGAPPPSTNIYSVPLPATPDAMFFRFQAKQLP